MKALITGVFGSVGSYMAEFIQKEHKDCEVHGVGRSGYNAEVDQSWVLDLRDETEVKRLIDAGQYDVIFHFASNADVAGSFGRQTEIFENNAISTSILFNAIKEHSIHSQVILASTSEVYGSCEHGMPITEEDPLAPTNPYAVSKTCQDLLAGCCNDAWDMNIVRIRMFSYFNPRRANLFSSHFARKIAEIEQGKREVLTHGNLKSDRTFMDINDCCEAYWRAQACRPEVYNVGSDKVHTVGGILTMLIALARCEIRTEEDPDLLRPTDVRAQVPVIDKFYEATGGWLPYRSVRQSLEHLLDHWREVVAAE